MKISYSWLQEFFTTKLPPPEKLAELLTLHVFEVEGVEKKGKDWVLDVAVLANRGYDCLSHLGIAREIAAITGFKISSFAKAMADKKDLRLKKKKTQRHPLSKYLSIEVKDTILCPRYNVALVMNVKVGSSPKWAQERLEALGINPINNVVDATNYVMFELGQPLHAFDFDKIAKQTRNSYAKQTRNIIVRNAKKGEKFEALDGNTYELDDSMLVIADPAKPLALAGIIGGTGSAIGKDTKEVVIESANFDRKTTYNSARKLNLRTEASLRFGHGLDPELVPVAQERVAELLHEWAQGQRVGGVLDIYPRRRTPKITSFDKNQAQNLLGISLKNTEIVSLFRRLAFSVKKSAQDTYRVEIPPFRNDIEIPEDLIEEVSRLIGYENVPESFPHVPLGVVPVSDANIWRDFTRSFFMQAGFTELYGYSFVSKDLLERVRWSVEGCVLLQNPVSREYAFLRPHLVIKMLEMIGGRKKVSKPIRIFEMGEIFSIVKNTLEEKNMLGAALVLPDKPPVRGTDESHPSRMGGKDEAFFEMKGAVSSLLERMGMSDVWFDSAGHTSLLSPISFWHPVRSSEIKVGSEKIGFLGEISPKVLEKFKIKERVVACEFDFTLLSRKGTEEKEYRLIPKYPALIRDIAVLVPTSTLSENVEGVIHTIGKELVVDTDLFDIYEGEGISEGMKNLAYHIVYQAEDHTLSEKEVDSLHKKIEQAMREREWEVR